MGAVCKNRWGEVRREARRDERTERSNAINKREQEQETQETGGDGGEQVEFCFLVERVELSSSSVGRSVRIRNDSLGWWAC